MKITAISEDGNRRAISGMTGASNAARLIPLQWSAAVREVRPTPDLVRGIALSADADAGRGSSPDLQSLIEALTDSYSVDDEIDEGKAKSHVAAAEIRENTGYSRDAKSSLQESGTAAEGIQRHLEVLEAAQAGGPNREVAEEAEPTEPRAELVSNHELPDIDQGQRLTLQDLPKAERGQTNVHLELPEGEAGQDLLKAELQAQVEAGVLNQEARTELESKTETAEQEKTDGEGLKEAVDTRVGEQQEKVESGQEQVEKDQDGLESARGEQDKAAVRVEEDASQISRDEGLVEASEQNLSVAEAKDQSAGRELSAAEGMWSQAEQRVASAASFQVPKSDQEKTASKNQQKQSNDNSSQNDKQLVVASAQRFKQKAAARESAARLRQAMTRRGVEDAQNRLNSDQDGLRQSEANLERSQQNLVTRTNNVSTAERNLDLSTTGLASDKEFMQRLAEMRDELEARREQNREVLERLETLRGPIDGNIEAARENEEKLREFKLNQSGVGRLELRELEVTPA